MSGQNADLMKAIQAAHRASECGDYYCGCWDQNYNDPDHKWFHDDVWPHTTKFLSALRALGYEVVPI